MQDDGWVIITNTITDTDDFLILNTETYEPSTIFPATSINKKVGSLNIQDRKILLNINEFLDGISASYKYNYNSIIEQFKIDLPRSKIFFNGKRIENANKLLFKINMDKFITQNFKFILPVLLTQAVCSDPFRILHEIYADVDNDVFLTDNGLLGEPASYRISSNESMQRLNIKKKLKLIEISEPKPYEKMYITFKLLITLSKDTNYITMLWNEHTKKCDYIQSTKSNTISIE